MAIFDPPQNPHPLTDHQKIFIASDYVDNPYGCAKFGANPSTRGFWANGWNITNFFYTFFSSTHLQVTLDGSNDADSRKDVPFGGFVDTASHFRGEIPQKNNFGGVNRRFQAKRAKYWKFHVIETNAPISTKFCTTIETIKNSSWVVQIGAQQIQDGWRPPFWKNR